MAETERPLFDKQAFRQEVYSANELSDRVLPGMDLNQVELGAGFHRKERQGCSLDEANNRRFTEVKRLFSLTSPEDLARLNSLFDNETARNFALGLGCDLSGYKGAVRGSFYPSREEQKNNHQFCLEGCVFEIAGSQDWPIITLRLHRTEGISLSRPLDIGKLNEEILVTKPVAEQDINRTDIMLALRELRAELEAEWVKEQPQKVYFEAKDILDKADLDLGLTSDDWMELEDQACVSQRIIDEARIGARKRTVGDRKTVDRFFPDAKKLALTKRIDGRLDISNLESQSKQMQTLIDLCDDVVHDRLHFFSVGQIKRLMALTGDKFVLFMKYFFGSSTITLRDEISKKPRLGRTMTKRFVTQTFSIIDKTEHQGGIDLSWLRGLVINLNDLIL